ncbi:MAG: 3-hydroxyacyl-CoA dehydrogenase NAD-binding domain-containing protein [Thermodesulfobacteriota bacterium]
MASDIRTVAVIGTGLLGTQIAIQAACFGYDVYSFDEVEGTFERTSQGLLAAMEVMGKKPVVDQAVWQESAARVRDVRHLEEAVGGADLVIESVPEKLELKRRIFSQVDALAPANAILATNSSSIPVSRMESATQRPQKCLNLHFYFPAFGLNIVDIMAGSQKSEQTMSTGVAWVRSVGCIPLPVKKEIFGFCFNRVWRAVKREALHMWADGFVDYQDIDRAWMVFTGMPIGPFGMMDQVGLDVIHNTELSYFQESKDPQDQPPAAFKAMVDRGELGMKTGKGFYDYPSPAYRRPDFLAASGATSQD